MKEGPGSASERSSVDEMQREKKGSKMRLKES
jgi:hypothetical protein